MKHTSKVSHTETKKGSFVHSRIDEDDKAQASFILGKIGLNVSDAIRLFLKQVIMKKGLPFPVRIPNPQTIEAMESAERGENLEETTLEQLHAQFQVERQKTAKHPKKKKLTRTK